MAPAPNSGPPGADGMRIFERIPAPAPDSPWSELGAQIIASKPPDMRPEDSDKLRALLAENPDIAAALGPPEQPSEPTLVEMTPEHATNVVILNEHGADWNPDAEPNQKLDVLIGKPTAEMTVHPEDVEGNGRFGN